MIKDFGTSIQVPAREQTSIFRYSHGGEASLVLSPYSFQYLLPLNLFPPNCLFIPLITSSIDFALSNQ